MTAGGATLAIDAGTSLIKAVVFDRAGGTVATAASPARVLHPQPTHSEQDMREVEDAVLACAARAAAQASVPVERVVVTAQGDGAWLVDAGGAPVGHAILWNDGRAAAVVAAWERDGTLDTAFRRNGSLGNAGLPHALIVWLRQHDPERLERADAVLTCGSWLFRALTGGLGLHPSEASAPWLDVRSGEPSAELLEAYGLSDLARLVPPVLRGPDLTLPLAAAAAARTGLPPGLPVTLAPYDVVTTAIGSGAAREGEAFAILGTTLCAGVLRAAPDTAGTPSGLTLLPDGDEPLVRAFPTLAGTGVLDWTAELLGLDSASAVTRLAAEAPAGARGVRVWPYLSPAGERAPFLDSTAVGVVAGLTFGAGRAELARAAVEGLAHVVRECVEAEGAPPARLALAGGGANSDLWCQAISDVTGLPVRRPDAEQPGARGAMLAGIVASGAVATVAEAADSVGGTWTQFEPDPAVRALHDDRHGDFLTTRGVLAPRWREWRTS